MINKKFNYIYKAMLSCCLNWRKNTESKNPKVLRTKNRRTIPFSKCAACNSKKSRYIKEQEVRGLLKECSDETLSIFWKKCICEKLGISEIK